MSLLNDVDRDYSNNWVISVDKWNSYRSIGYQNKLDITHIQNANVSGIGTNSQFTILSGGLSAHGDVSGVVAFDPNQYLNYTIEWYNPDNSKIEYSSFYGENIQQVIYKFFYGKTNDNILI